MSSSPIEPPFDSDLVWHREHCGDFYCNCRDEDSAEIERAEDMTEEWRWGYIHGYLHGWSDKTAGRQFGEGRNLRKPEVADG